MKGEEYKEAQNETHFTKHQHQNQIKSYSIPSPTAPHKSSDGATIESSRRPRGRPPGSKNKPKPPIIITRDSSDPVMSPYILEVSAGADVVDAVAVFSKRRGLSLSLLTASGPVANVTLRQPGPAASVTFHGRFEVSASVGGGPWCVCETEVDVDVAVVSDRIQTGDEWYTKEAGAAASVTFHGGFKVLSLSGTVGPDPVLSGLGLRVVIAGPQGQVVGGIVAGPLVAASTVYVVAATMNRAEFVRLPEDEEVRSYRGGGEEEEREAAPVERWGGNVAAVWAPAASHYQ